MSRKKKGAPVVIVRKDKRLNKTGHLLAFMLTGGMSAPVTAAKAATNAAYNARTRELQRKSEEAEEASEPQQAATGKDECPRCGATYVMGGARVKGHNVPNTTQRCALSGTPIT